jgi:hypothetical protein
MTCLQQQCNFQVMITTTAYGCAAGVGNLPYLIPAKPRLLQDTAAG